MELHFLISLNVNVWCDAPATRYYWGKRELSWKQCLIFSIEDQRRSLKVRDRSLIGVPKRYVSSSNQTDAFAGQAMLHPENSSRITGLGHAIGRKKSLFS